MSLRAIHVKDEVYGIATQVTDLVEEAYSNGVEAGHDVGYDEGYDAASNLGQEEERGFNNPAVGGRHADAAD